MHRILLLAVILISVTTHAQPPVITSFSPASGPIGSTVTINGSNFSTTTSANIVYFGGVRASVTAATANALTVTVPAGATQQPITVTTNNLTASSKLVFFVSFSGGSGNFFDSSFAPATGLTTGLYPYAVCAADLDGDGKPDLLSPGNANSPVSNISYLRNTGMAGTLSFGPEVDLPAPAGSFPYSMVTADLDGDGRLDVIFTASTGSLCVYPNSSSPGAIGFGARQDFATGTDPFSVAVADLDGDGKPDIVVANFLSNSLSVYRNISTVGTIAFAPKIDLTTGLAPHSVAIGDLDGDGKPDLAVTNTYASTVSLFKNNSSPGTLSFATKADIATGPDEPFGLAMGDLDADGKPDLVVTYANSNKTTEASVSLSVFKNNSPSGSFAFAAPANYGTGDSYNPAIGDLNGDGFPDVVVPTKDNSVLVYPHLNIATSTFLVTPAGVYYASGGYAVAIADLDGDNQPDMAVADFISNTIGFYKNNTTAPTISSVTPLIGSTGTTVTIYGFNLGALTGVSFGGTPAASYTIISSGAIRAVVGAGASGAVSLTGPGWTTSFPGFVFTPPASISSITPSAAGSGTTITIHGTKLSSTTGISFGGIPAASFAVVSDTIVTAVVGAGATGDVVLTTPVVTSTLPGAFTFIPAPALTGFTPTSGATGTTVTITGTNFSNASTVTLGGTPVLSFTVNSATSITAIVAGGSTGAVSVTTPGGVTSLTGFTYLAKTPPLLTSFSPASGKIGTTVTLTGSGFDPISSNDVVYFGAVRANVSAASPTSLTVTVPAGASLQPISVTTLGTNLAAYSANPFIVTFDTGVLQFDNAVNYGFGGAPVNNVSAGDLDGDGKADLVISGDNPIFDGSNNLIDVRFGVMRNTTSAIGAISFAPLQFIGGTLAHRAASVTDVDGDGKPDVVLIGYDSVYVYRNTSTPGNISFDTAVRCLTGNDGQDIAVADLDGDGRPEIIAMNSFSSTVSLLRNTCTPGHISFAAKLDFATGSLPTGVAVSDFDGDGKKDLAVSCRNDNTVSVLLNQSTAGNLQFAPAVSLAVASNPAGIVANPSGIQAGDLDGDGKPDIATSNYFDNQTSVFVNQSTPGHLAFGASVGFDINYAVQAFSIRLAMADMDGDGKLDLALINQVSPGGASAFKNTSTPGNMNFSHGTNPSLGFYPLGVAMQDFDGDGRPDMAAAIELGAVVLRNISGEQPVILAFTPTAGMDTTTITITGKNFDSTASVSFNGIPATSFTVVSSTVITAIPPVNSSGVVTVVTQKGTANLAGFVYAAPPIINGATPINATTGGTVTLTGDNFLGATAVSFGGVPATSFVVVNSNTLTAVVAAGADGAISMTTPYGTGTLAGFHYIPEPTITSFSPTVGVPGTVVTIIGTNFGNASNVKFGGVEADTFTIVSPTEITAVVGAGASGMVTVTNEGWTNYLDGFIFDPKVTISADGPTSFCEGDSVVLRSSISLGNQWYQGGVVLPGATADTLVAISSGTYNDKLTIPTVTTPVSSPITVTVNPIPLPPVITAAPGGGMASSSAGGNQWYQDTLTAISGANSGIYTPTDSGYYAVKVTSLGCTSAFSNRYFYHLPVKTPDTVVAGSTLVVAPNPVIGGRVQVNYSYPGITTLDAELSDMSGHTLLLVPDLASGGYINMANMPKGVYLLRLRDADGKTYGKVSILK